MLEFLSLFASNITVRKNGNVEDCYVMCFIKCLMNFSQLNYTSLQNTRIIFQIFVLSFSDAHKISLEITIDRNKENINQEIFSELVRKVHGN